VSAAIYECDVAHARRTPLINRFRYRSYLWLVDLDDLPRLPRPLRPLAGFDSRDHLGVRSDVAAPVGAASIRDNVDRYLATHGIDLDGGRVLMLASARVLGYVFNPLSVYWCHDRSGALRCVIAEIHNTFGELHCYVLHTDEHGRADVDKEFYVSPFEPVLGRYQMRLPTPDDRLDLSITLHRDGQAPFVATVKGTRRTATAMHVLAVALRHPLAPLLVTIRIRRQGIALWARGLRIQPRPSHLDQEAVR